MEYTMEQAKATVYAGMIIDAKVEMEGSYSKQGKLLIEGGDNEKCNCKWLTRVSYRESFKWDDMAALMSGRVVRI